MRRMLLLVLLLTVSGCTSSTVDSPAHSVGACLPPSPSAVPSPSVVPASSIGRVPDVELECLEGGGTVRLTDLHRPAIVNLWASWCAPCRTELPAFQAYAARAGDRVAVIGVDTGDTRTAGGALLSDLRVSYPTLFDDRQRLLKAVGRTALPVTLFVDAGGGVRYLDNSTPLDEAAIARLASTYLGVAG
jgi:thiol-disulfide isomerase/thioredoxin